MRTLYESIMQSRFPAYKIEESILNKSGVGKIYLIQKWLDEHDIKNYTINNKGEIDVAGDVDLSNCGLTELPSFIQFGAVKGSFDCSYNNIESLEGVPERVGGDFNCRSNNLESLEGAPKEVGGDFVCKYNDAKFTETDVRKVCNVKREIMA